MGLKPRALATTRVGDAVSSAIESAIDNPDDVGAQIAAAYACDREGREHEAVTFYDRAAALGVPADRRRRFLVGHGSTLRNVGRLDESLSVLRTAVDGDPGYAAYHAFLGLTLHSLGRHREAAAAMLECSIVGGAGLDGYERALALYRDDLLSES